MEILFATAIVLLAAAGLATGLLLGGRGPRTACDGVACIGGGRCETCPRRKGVQADD